MADDDMEISSDHDHNNDGDDIDIDIDLTAGPADEDDVLEDATSIVDFGNFGNDFHPQQSSNNDQDYSMEDGDSMPDVENFDDEIFPNSNYESMSVAAIESLHSDEPVLDEVDGPVGAGAPETDVIPTKEDTPIAESGETEIAKLTDENIPEELTYEELPPDQNDQTLDSSKGNNSNHGSRPATPGETNLSGPYISPKTETPPISVKANSPVSPPISNHEGDQQLELNNVPSPLPVLEEAHEAQEDSGPQDDGGANEVTEEVVQTDTGHLEEHLDVAVYDVLVSYRETEYALFSTSELDDPDSFFLADHSMIYRPLSELLQAIREIIHDDLTGEDELCMTVESLGLETEEASSLIADVTLAQILQLHEDLMHNDDVNPLPALRLLLGTRPNFYKRLMNLSQSAADGKGLSELFPWQDGSDNLDSLVDVGETEYNDGSAQENLEYDEPHGENEPPNGLEGEDLVGQEDAPEEDAPEETRSELHEAVEDIPGRILSPERNVPLEAIKETGPSLSDPSPNQDLISGEYDEDGDLIDYSEDEGEDEKDQRQTSPAHKVVETDTTSPTEATSAPTQIETERQRENEESQENQEEDQLSHAGGPNDQPHDATEHDEYSEEFGNNEDEESGENPPTDGDSNNMVAAEEYHGIFDDDELKFDGEQNKNPPHETEFNIEEITYQDEENGNELEPQSKLEHEGHLEVPTSQGQVYPDDQEHDPEHDYVASIDFEGINYHEGSLEVPEGAESSATMSGDEIQYEDFGEEAFNDPNGDVSYAQEDGEDSHVDGSTEQKDEIDYEDDEEDIPTILPTSSKGIASPGVASPSITRKRSREELEAEDGSVLNHKDPKRPRP